MNLSETLELIRAGFTRDEILAMQAPAQPAPAPALEPVPVQPPAPAPEQPPAPAPAPEPAPAPAPALSPAPAAPEPPKELSDVERLIKSLGNLAKGIDVPPQNDLTIEEKLANTILASMGIKQKEEN